MGYVEGGEAAEEIAVGGGGLEIEGGLEGWRGLILQSCVEQGIGHF